MKRKISDLKPNEAIQINNEREFKGIAKITFTPESFFDYPFYYTNDGVMKGYDSTVYNKAIASASDFLPKKKKATKKWVRREIANYLNVTDPAHVLTELPEKWCVKVTDDNSYMLHEWLQSQQQGDYKLTPGMYVDSKHRITGKHKKYTEITTEQFREWVYSDQATGKLELNRWYKNPVYESVIFAREYSQDNCISGYGYIGCGNVGWHDELDQYIFELEPATDEEVENILIEEAKRRGFVEGAVYKWDNIENRTVKGDLYFKHGRLSSGIYTIMEDDGKWATIVEPEIDWSVPGQLVVTDIGTVMITSGEHSGDHFKATVVLPAWDAKLGHIINNVYKVVVKPYTGEPIILQNGKDQN